MVKLSNDDFILELNNYYTDDNLNLLKKIESNYIDLIYFDPLH